MFLDGIVHSAGTGLTPTEGMGGSNGVQPKNSSSESFMGYDLGLSRLKKGIGEITPLDKSQANMDSGLHGMMLLFGTVSLKDQA